MKYSLIIGTFNPKIDWLKAAINSADGLFDECIVVDDCSNNDEEILETVSSFRIKGGQYFYSRHKYNQGFYAARNSGVKLSSGDVICWIDDDDVFIRENVNEMKSFVEKTDADIWSFPVETFGLSSGLWGCLPESFDALLVNNTIPSGCWYKKSVWNDVGGYKSIRSEDWLFWVEAMHLKKKFSFFDKPVYKHRMRQDSLSAKWVGSEHDKIREEMMNMYKNLNEREF